MSEIIHIARDTREQTPYNMRGMARCDVQGLETLDYCIWGDWTEIPGRKTVRPNWAIERKTFPDFIGAFFKKENLQNEREKISRAQAWYPLPIIYVIDAPVTAIATYNYTRFPSGRVTPKSVEAVIDNLRYANVHVIFAGSEYMGAYTTVSLLRRRHRDLKKKQGKLKDTK